MSLAGLVSTVKGWLAAPPMAFTPPADASVGADGHILVYRADKPQLLANITDLRGTVRVTVWKTPAVFISIIGSPSGIPKDGEKKKCWQMYFGVKCIGRDAAGLYLYEYKPSEQFAVRYHDVQGTLVPEDMAGS